MNADILFSIANGVAMAGWGILLLYYSLEHRFPLFRRPVEQAWIPLLLSVFYALVLTLSFTGLVPGSSGDFSSLAGVRSLFESDYALFAGWAHYLAFDLLVGIRIGLEAKRHGVSIFILIPVWFFAFMFGPAGYALWRFIRPMLIKGQQEGMV